MGSNCPLCNVKEEDILWKDGSFFGIICKTCGIPLCILKEHKASATEEEMEEMKDILKRRYPGYRLRGIGMRSIPAHFHEHAIKRGEDGKS